ncbi:MAG: hypothetical protein KBG20_22070 [Caldilineaceae bacterium]|nr:hypothetical protein [Caldilineaceae bacterium]
MSMQTDKQFDAAGRFLLPDYTQTRPFASFLPGIAGPLGIPLWVFYVNRGQGIAAFGIQNKDNPIMEFQPANKAYQMTPSVGFRTFIKAAHNGDGATFYEPFAPWSNGKAQRTMAVGMNDLLLREENPTLGLTTEVAYFTLSGEPFAGLMRRVTLTNTGQTPVSLEVLDGMPAVTPYGVDNGALKNTGRTIEAWMEVFNLDRGVPYYRLGASAADTAEVSAIRAGHFYVAFTEGQSAPLPVLVDPAVIFGADTSLYRPLGFVNQSLASLVQARQITVGRTPSAFCAARASLAPGQSVTIQSVIGHVGDLSVLDAHLPRILASGYAAAKHAEAVDLAQSLTDIVDTHTAHPRLDAYIRQNFLDNVLRGGWPIQLGGAEKPFTVHLYSRKHGDLERDYNAFALAAEPYSQGNGNYRDVNQNRRSDVLLNPAVKEFNLISFLGLIQADGYNPLVVLGSRFTLEPARRAELQRRLGLSDAVMALLTGPFTPGSVLRAIQDQQLALPLSWDELLIEILAQAQQHFEADFGEGFWADHWTYNLDLVENYAAVYPEQMADLLFGAAQVPFFDSPAVVRPRSQRYVLAEGGPRQFNAVYEDPEKESLIHARRSTGMADPNLARTRHGWGDIYRVTPFAKMLMLATIKFATLDPSGMAVELEGGKPGWYDALNGLPGLFGSSMPESYELLRLLDFLIQAADRQEALAGPTSVHLPAEVVTLFQQMMDLLTVFDYDSAGDKDFRFWVGSISAREAYRAEVRLGFDGRESALELADVRTTLIRFRAKLAAGIRRGELLGPVPPTYFVHQVTNYEVVCNEAGEAERDGEGRPYIQAMSFAPRPLPAFLEGPVRAMRTLTDPDSARRIHEAVLASGLYDAKLGMFKVNASLAGEAHDIGRARAFTPGWLENESIWLHMAYKYMLSLLLAGLVDEFYAAAKTGLVPFMDPAIYGRSPLENSSFIVSSAHPDETLHGAGFVARLSGSTAEFIHIWSVIMAGPQPFVLEKGELVLALRPALAAWLFDVNDQVAFTFLGRCRITYHNPTRQDTHAPSVRIHHIILHPHTSDPMTVDGPIVPAPHAQRVRNGEIMAMDVYLEGE